MRVRTSTAALAAITLSAVLATLPASAAVRIPAASAGIDTTFDLGVDVSDVAPTAGDVSAYLAGLEPETQAAILGACGTFVQNPVDARSTDTLAFCKLAIGNAPSNVGVKTFATVSPIVQETTPTAAAPPAQAPDPANVMTNGQSGNRYRVYPNDGTK